MCGYFSLFELLVVLVWFNCCILDFVEIVEIDDKNVCLCYCYCSKIPNKLSIWPRWIMLLQSNWKYNLDTWRPSDQHNVCGISCCRQHKNHIVDCIKCKTHWLVERCDATKPKSKQNDLLYAGLWMLLTWLESMQFSNQYAVMMIYPIIAYNI